MMPPGPEYPKAMYKDGGEALIWGKPVMTLTVRSVEQEVEALADGWRFRPEHPHPLDHDGDGDKGGSLPRRGRPPKVRE